MYYVTYTNIQRMNNLLVTGYVTTIWGVARYFNTILLILC